MPVTGTSYTQEGPQADGSRWCREIYTVTGGAKVEFYYLAPGNFNVAASITARTPLVNTQLANNEAATNYDKDAAPSVVHQTMAEFLLRLREEVRVAKAERATYLGWWIIRRITAAHFTDAQCATAWGLTGANWTTYKTNNLNPRSTAWTTVAAAVGV